MKHIIRDTYLNRLKGLKNTPDIKIITGLRRSGKSQLMRDYMDYLKRTDQKANIIYIDFFDLTFEDLKEYKALHTYIKDKYIENMHNYVLVDEVQLCNRFELAINSLHNSGNFDIYLTGSNAFLLSSDLTTLFTGRFIEVSVFPFSFFEYAQYFDTVLDKERLFDDYVSKGGLSGSYVYPNEVDQLAYITDVYKTILHRDLVDKYKLPDTMILDRLTEYMMDNVSNLCSSSNISTTLCANDIATNHVTIGKYLKYLCNAFMFYQIKRYDIKGKKYLASSEKYYLSDLGFRYAQLGNRNLDYGRCYENIVCIELLRRGYNVYVGKLYKKEIDFVVLRGSEKMYIQVSDNISDPDTFTREVSSLLQIKDAYPKIVIARTRHPEYQYEGIRIINLIDWLLDNQN